jgi:hypothetical protein
MNNFDLNKKFLNRLLKFGKITERDWDAELGKQCGYKKCCIDYFIKIRSYGLPVGLITDLVLGYEPFDYVRCPKCRQINNKSCGFNKPSIVRAISSNLIEKNILSTEQFFKYFKILEEYDNV